MEIGVDLGNIRAQLRGIWKKKSGRWGKVQKICKLSRERKNVICQ